MTTKNPLALFNAKHCLAYNGEKPATVIGYSGDAKYTGPLVKDLQKICKWTNFLLFPTRDIAMCFPQDI
jgi:hypothetical protein